jgi:hypothetical protein
MKFTTLALSVLVFIIAMPICLAESNSATAENLTNQMDNALFSSEINAITSDNTTLFDGFSTKLSIAVIPCSTIDGAMEAVIYIEGNNDSTAYQIVKLVAGSENGRRFVVNGNTSSAIAISMVAGKDTTAHDTNITESCGVYSYSKDGTFDVTLGEDPQSSSAMPTMGQVRSVLDQANQDVNSLNGTEGMDCYNRMKGTIV